MRTAKTVLTVIQERGKQKKPIERVYKLLFNRELYLNAYAKLYPLFTFNNVPLRGRYTFALSSARF